jgi:micrococcal nuclease
VNVNLELVRRGAATVYLYGGDRGKSAARLLAAARAARAERRGMWGACRVVWDPTGPATMASTAWRPAPLSGVGRGACDPSYPTVCIAPLPPDLDCADVPYRDFVVRQPDPHGFDGRDDDGRGCE